MSVGSGAPRSGWSVRRVPPQLERAYVVPAPGASIDAGANIARARERLANYKVPRYVVAVAELPTNATGKVVKDALRARAAADAARA